MCWRPTLTQTICRLRHCSRPGPGAKIGIGAHIRDVQKVFRPMFCADDLKVDGGRLRPAAERWGSHSPWRARDRGDRNARPYGRGRQLPRSAMPYSWAIRLFMPDYGTARTDFPGGDARRLYRSIHRLLDLPPETRLFLCHDYKAPGPRRISLGDDSGRAAAAMCTSRHGVTEDEFVRMREARDATLSTPKLLLPSIQVNIQGRPAAASGREWRFLPRIPVRIKAGSQPRLRAGLQEIAPIHRLMHRKVKLPRNSC